MNEMRVLANQLRDLGRVEAPDSVLPSVLERTGHRDAYTPCDSPIGPVYVAYNGHGVSAVLAAASAGWADAPVAVVRPGFIDPAAFWVFDPAGERVEWLVAEVTNIPWRERHAYVVPFGDGTMRLDKAFYVSPYLPMDLHYEWRFDPPGPSLGVEMRCLRDGERVFDASLAMTRRPLRGATRAGVWWRHPWMGVRTVAAPGLRGGLRRRMPWGPAWAASSRSPRITRS